MREARGGCNWRGREDVGRWGPLRGAALGGNWGSDPVSVADHGIWAPRPCRLCFGLEPGQPPLSPAAPPASLTPDHPLAPHRRSCCVCSVTTRTLTRPSGTQTAVPWLAFPPRVSVTGVRLGPGAAAHCWDGAVPGHRLMVADVGVKLASLGPETRAAKLLQQKPIEGEKRLLAPGGRGTFLGWWGAVNSDGVGSTGCQWLLCPLRCARPRLDGRVHA